MLNIKEFEELKFFAKKVAEVHWPEHGEFIKINAIVEKIEEENLENVDFAKLRELSDNYIIPEWACNAQITLLTLLKKLDNN
jgi:iron-sulfur cluster repair protein YtfE (RIC family)